MEINNALREIPNDRQDSQYKLYQYNVDVIKDTTVLPLHWHDDFEIIKCDCSGKAFINGLPFYYNVGDIFIFNPGDLHCILSSTFGKTQAILFNYKWLKFEYDDISQTNLLNRLRKRSLVFQNIIRTTDSSYLEFNELLLKIIHTYHSNQNAHTLYEKALVYELVAYSYINNKIIPNFETNLNTNLEYTKKLLLFFDEHYYEDITLQSAADYLGLNRNYMIRIFKQSVGKTPIEYLNNLRLKKSRALLYEDLSITDVALSVGFKETSYFISCFKKKYGTTPLAYRKTYQKNNTAITMA